MYSGYTVSEAIMCNLTTISENIVPCCLPCHLHYYIEQEYVHIVKRGWSGGVLVLGKLPVLGRPTYLE